MARKIAGAIDGPFILSLTDPLASSGSDNPLLITSTGTVASTGSGIDGVDGPASTAWIITNRGIVSSGGIGIALAGAGFLYNSGMVSGSSDGLFIGASGIVANSGTISGIFGVRIGGLGVVQNNGAITGAYGVDIGGFGVVANQGSIEGGVEMDGGGVVTNRGFIDYGSGSGDVLISGGRGMVTNDGTMFAYATAIGLDDGGVVTNGGSGFIHSPRTGIQINGGGAVTNQGSIIGGEFTAVSIYGVGAVTNQGFISASTAIYLNDGGVVTNRGTISGGGTGVEIGGGSGKVINQGTIAGGAVFSLGDSVVFGPSTTNNLLVIDPGAVFIGAVQATSGTNSTIELAKGTGTTSGIGTGQFSGFDTLVVDPGAKWTLGGPNAIGTVLNNGSLGVAGSLDVSSGIAPASTGLFQLVGPSTLEVAAALGTSSKIRFDTGSDLVVDHFALFGQNVGTNHYAGSLLESFGGSTIDLKDFGAAGLGASFSNSAGLLQLTNSASQMATLDFQTSSLGAGTFHFNSDGGSGVLITHS